ncbi:MAG: HlyD family efflux transporter periplasmic adaptor subunit [Deltaproteobacteria bacterium]
MEEGIKRRRVKAKPMKKLKWGRLLIILAGLFYFVIFINAFFGQQVKTYIVTYGKLEEADNSYGFVVRNEKIINSNISGVLKPIKQEGERISKGTIVASILNDSANEAEKKIADIDDRIQRVIRENEKSSTYAKLDFSGDIKKIDADTEKKIFELTRLDREKNFEQVGEIKELINENIRKKAEISGELGQSSQYVRNLINEKKTLQNNMMAMKHNIVSEYPGVVSYTSDGLENVLIPQTLKTLTITGLEEITNKIDSDKMEKSNVVRVVDNFKCYICAVVSNKERIPKIKIADDVWLRFSGEGEELIPAVINNISIEKDGRALITFSITNNVENLIGYRKVNFDIVWSSSKGLKVPITAVKKEKFINVGFDDKQKINQIKEGDKVKISGCGDKPISGAVYDISKNDAGGYNIDFILLEDAKELVAGNQVNIQIDWFGVKNADLPQSFSGTCLEKEGVMAANTSYADFEEVKVIKRDKEYAIVNEAASKFDKGITLYEEILLNASNIEEGRQIRKWDL